MSATCNIDQMATELNRHRRAKLYTQRGRARFDKWKREERIINRLISGRRETLKENERLIVEG